METFSALLVLNEGNSPVTGEFPSQRPVTWSSDVFFDLRLNRINNRDARELRRRRAHYDLDIEKQETKLQTTVKQLGTTHNLARRAYANYKLLKNH